jgi:hypothetical protein
MPQLTRRLYDRAEGADQDHWRLVFDTDAPRIFVEHEQIRGDMRGSGYGSRTDEIDLAAFLNGRGPGRQQLVQLLGALFEDERDAVKSEVDAHLTGMR